MTCITLFPSGNKRIYNEKPGGLFNCVNLSFTTLNKFNPDTLIVRLDGNTLDPDQYTTGVDEKSFTLIVDASDPKALNSAPESDECLRVDYTKKPDTDCITTFC